MSPAYPKRGRKRLEPKDYRELHLQILRRDRWKCQYCGRGEDLQVHHIEPRGKLGSDTDKNLITLCANCHRNAHHKNLKAAARLGGRKEIRLRF